MSDTLPDAPSLRSTRSREAMVAAAASLLLAVLATWPTILSPRSLVLGHPGNDNWNHVWGYWWVSESLGRGEWPARTDLLVHPRGGTLYFIDTIQAVLSWPLQLLAGPAFAYNIVVIGGLALSAMAAWLLARRLVGDPVAAGAAALVYGVSPHLLGQAYNGISETVCAGWLPLTLWLLVRLMDRPTWLRALALGCSAAVCMLTSWYYGLFAFIGGMVLIVWQAARQPYAVDWRRSVGPVLGAGAVAAAGVIPFLLTFQASLEAGDALVTRDPEFVRASLLQHNITDIVAFFRPSKTASPDLLALYGEQLIIVIYLGWVGLSLAIAAVGLTRRRREMAPWLWLGAIFFLFSLGPYLNLGGEYVEVGGRRLPLPFLALFEAIPIFDRISHPFRFVVGVSLAVAMLAAHGLRHLLRKRSLAARAGVLAAVAVCVLAEFALGSPASLPVPVSDARVPVAYEEMREDPVEGAVLDLPMTVPNLERAVYVWYQSVHGRPVPWGLNDPMPRMLLRNRLTATLIRLEATRAHVLSPRLPELDLIVGARTLARLGYRYVVMHEALYPAFKRGPIEAVLTGVFGEPVRYEDDGLLVWVVPQLD